MTRYDMRLRRRSRRALLVVASGLVLGLTVTVGASALAGSSGSATTVGCSNDGWKKLATAEGNPFANQSACLSYAARGGALVTCTVTGTNGNDHFRTVPAGTVTCGFGGNDRVSIEPDVFGTVYGTFYGGPGDDSADAVVGTFVGGDGNDGVWNGGSAMANIQGTFIGGAGNDYADVVNGTFDGGRGNDYVFIIAGGTFLGGPGADRVNDISETGVYNGGPDIDGLCNAVPPAATVVAVELLDECS